MSNLEELEKWIDDISIRGKIDIITYKKIIQKLSELKADDGECKHEQVDLVRHACKCKECGKLIETTF